jgi:hypothetical protein
MHPAEHRVLRELSLFTHQLERHWRMLGARLGGREGELLLACAAEAEEIRGELQDAASRRGVAVGPSAETGGRLLSARPPAPDVALERNQALRWALHDVQHCTLGLRYAARLAAARHDDALRGLLDAWAERLERHEQAARDAAIELGDDPDAAIAPADPSSAGQTAHQVAVSMGAFGEWLDRQASRRRA